MASTFPLNIWSFKFKRNQESHGFVYWKSASANSHHIITWCGESFWLKPELIPLSLTLLPPRGQCSPKVPGEAKAQGGLWWQIVLSFSVPVQFVSWTLPCASSSLVSILPLRLNVFWGVFFFHFLAGFHRNDTHSANSALDSLLQTRTTHSPVREQSERKMKNNIRKEPFGKLHKNVILKSIPGLDLLW